MALKDKLPVSYLLFTTRGRINRLTYWVVSIFIWTSFYVLFNALQYAFSYHTTWIIYPILFWTLTATAIKRLHDSNKNGFWLWIILVPVLGPIILVYLLGFKKGSIQSNGFGAPPHHAPDYFKNPDISLQTGRNSHPLIVDDVTQLNPVHVAAVVRPESIEALQQVIRDAVGPVSIGGGRFSMGGQTASKGSTHIDLRSLNKIIEYTPATKSIHVQAGIRWCDIQQVIDADQLSVKIMQTYANFTVGGAISVNCHGRYIGLGPVILSVRSIQIVMADGSLVSASPVKNSELYFASIGCYNAIGVIATVELDLEDNIAVMRTHELMRRSDYEAFFFDRVRDNEDVIFHNGDLYPPNYTRVRAVSWMKTDKRPTEKTKLMPLNAAYPIERYFISAFSRSRFGKWRREHIIDPILYRSKKIHWRNYEAGYDVLELEPESRKKSTYVLQEYFVPVARFDEFAELMAAIFSRFNVNVLNVSIRHAKKDPGSLLAWAREEVFAFVIWYKQGTLDADRKKVAEWTKQLIDAALTVNGSYYLPYQAHATPEQFHRAYPNAHALFELKKKLDPDFKFRNIIWDTYYKTTNHGQ